MIPKDIQLHLAFGVAAVVYMVGVLMLFTRFGPQAAIMAAVTGLCVGYELQQKLRGEGEPSVKDAAAGIAAGGAATLLLTLTGVI